MLRPTLWGSFNLSQTPIPYYQTILSLEEVSKELELVENLPSDLRSKWRLEELFQREIDWDRVEKQIVNGYLRRPEKLKFFNSLTVALLPLDTNRMLAKKLRRHPARTGVAGCLHQETVAGYQCRRRPVHSERGHATWLHPVGIRSGYSPPPSTASIASRPCERCASTATCPLTPSPQRSPSYSLC